MQSVNTILATVNFAICPNCNEQIEINNEQIGECITCSDCGETSFIPDYVEIETT